MKGLKTSDYSGEKILIAGKGAHVQSAAADSFKGAAALSVNNMALTLRALSKNESFARSVVAAFAVELDPTLDEINDIKTAVSEAVTNCVVHAYNGSGEGDILLEAEILGSSLHIKVTDYGVGIDDIEKARQPYYTTKPQQERSGMGFTVMETFMDGLEISRNAKGGTTVAMIKNIIRAG